MEVFSRHEFEELLFYKSKYQQTNNSMTYFRNKTNNSKLIDDYSQIPLRKRIELIRTLYSIIASQNSFDEEIKDRYKTILSNILQTISDEELQSCIIVEDKLNDMNTN